jgi:hypothetical protein
LTAWNLGRKVKIAICGSGLVGVSKNIITNLSELFARPARSCSLVAGAEENIFCNKRNKKNMTVAGFEPMP